MEYEESLNEKWRKELFRICVILAAIGTITEIVIYLYDSNHRTLFLSDLLYRTRFIYIPSSLNLLVIVVTAICLKSKRISNQAKNTWACILIYFLCANTQMIHYVYGPLLMLPTIAIFVTILFANRRLTRGISLASLVSLSIACMQASQELRKDDPQLLSDAVLAALVMLVAYIAARLLTRYVSEQIRYILTIHDRQKKLIEECNIDPLMGIGNRRAMTRELEKIVRELPGKYAPQLLLLDIDDFKNVNDDYGHLAGDEVLASLGGLVHDRTNQNLNAFRYGGDEIIVIIKEKDAKQVYEECLALQSEFASINYSFDAKKRFTISGGLVAYRNGMTAEEWIKEADEVLYQAKEHGKN